MGLTTHNYKIDDKLLENAYAIIKSIQINKNKGIATFVIQTSRDAAINKDSLNEFSINFEVNRDESPYITAYKQAKKEILVDDLVPTTGEKIKRSVKMPLYGWEDDIEEVENGINN